MKKLFIISIAVLCLSGCAQIFWGIICPPKYQIGDEICYGAIKGYVIDRDCTACSCRYKINTMPMWYLDESNLQKCNF
jgi:hypothetical protein